MIVLYACVVFGGVLLALGLVAKLVERRHRRRWRSRRLRPGYVATTRGGRPHHHFGEMPAGEFPRSEP